MNYTNRSIYTQRMYIHEYMYMFIPSSTWTKSNNYKLLFTCVYVFYLCKYINCWKLFIHAYVFACIFEFFKTENKMYWCFALYFKWPHFWHIICRHSWRCSFIISSHSKVTNSQAQCISFLLDMTKCLAEAMEGRKGLFCSQYKGLQFIWRGSYGSQSLRQLITFHLQAVSRELVLSSFFLLSGTSNHETVPPTFRMLSKPQLI